MKKNTSAPRRHHKAAEMTHPLKFGISRLILMENVTVTFKQGPCQGAVRPNTKPLLRKPNKEG
jgi:hypothetical protein